MEVRNPDGSTDHLASATLAGCGAASRSGSLYNNREETYIEMLDVDVEGLLDCLHSHQLMGASKDLDDSSEGELVWCLGIDGPNANWVNNYGVRVFNGREIVSSLAAAPAVRGLTIVTDQAIYVQGDYSAVNRKPAAFLADSLNVLSNNWSDTRGAGPLSGRVASDTTIFAAFLAGTDTTGGFAGPGGRDQDVYNGGVENYPRVHETWSGRTLTYLGSFVSLNRPRHVDGA